MYAKDKITVAWLDPGTVSSDFAVSICDIFRELSDRIAGRVIVRSGGAITRGRNASIHQFLTQSNDEWVLLVDADMSFTPADVRKLIDAADKDKAPVVGGLCFAQSGQYVGSFQTLIPTIYMTSTKRPQAFDPMWDYPKDQLVECDATGAAFLLVHRRVLEAVQQMVGLGQWSWFHEGPTDDLSSWLGEDVTFCNLIKAAGFKIYIHTGARSGHHKGVNYVLDEAMYEMIMRGVASVSADA